jgi:hypothetical protein
LLRANFTEMGGYPSGRRIERARVLTDWGVHHVVAGPSLEQLLALARGTAGTGSIPLAQWRQVCNPFAVSLRASERKRVHV